MLSVCHTFMQVLSSCHLSLILNYFRPLLSDTVVLVMLYILIQTEAVIMVLIILSPIQEDNHMIGSCRSVAFTGDCLLDSIHNPRRTKIEIQV